MNKIYKLIGVSALVITLICNLQYSFFDANKNPNGAQASWTYTDPYYLTETLHCGNEPDVWLPGEWFYVDGSNVSPDISWVYPYMYGYFYFVPDPNSTLQCGLNQPSTYPGFNHNGYEITAPMPPTFPF
ncbi:hypothetical protein [Mucilaginibacter antarcticus]|uniref:Uncharacterized protein n=1 Tax=Mucilaginibacter antarcticus TaxID=1855725 RepID=A0ABW5XSA4_9SPHI